jgi:hypothetical protein
MTCRSMSAVDAHFNDGLAPDQEHAMRLHLPTCPLCTRRYERQLLFASLVPDAPGPKARLRRGLPLPTRTWRRWVAPASAVLAIAACAILVVGRLRTPSEGAFHARGTSVQAPGSVPTLQVYRVPAGAGPVWVGSVPDPSASRPIAIDRADELAFAYTNPTAKKHLLVFAADEHRHVYWYYPAWTSEGDNPGATPIVSTKDPVELRESVGHSFDAPKVQLHAVFAEEALSVREIEARVRAAPPLAPTLGLTGGALEASREVQIH